MDTEAKISHRQQEIIAAAEKVFGEHGYAQTKMDAVAAQAGLSKGTIYNYFPSKADLFRAVFANMISVTEHDVEKLIGSALPAKQRLESLLDYWFGQLSYFNRLGRLVLEFWANAARDEQQGQLSQMLQELYAKHRSMIASILDDGVAAGQFRVEYGTHVAASLIMGILDGVEIQTILDVGIEVNDQFIAGLKRAIMLGLSAENIQEEGKSPQDSRGT